MKRVKMLKTFGTRVQGFIYSVTDRFAGILIDAKLAVEEAIKETEIIEPEPEERPKRTRKENKEARARKTK